MHTKADYAMCTYLRNTNSGLLSCRLQLIIMRVLGSQHVVACTRTGPASSVGTTSFTPSLRLVANLLQRCQVPDHPGLIQRIQQFLNMVGLKVLVEVLQ